MEITTEEPEEDIKQLREWLGKMPYIVQDYDDKFLRGFLKGCKFNLEKTKTALENFNSLGMRFPEFFGTYDPFHWELQEHLSITPIYPLPQRINADTPVIMIGSDLLGKIDPYQKHPLEFLRYWLMMIYIHLWENNFGQGNWIFICECKNGTLTEMRDVNAVVIKNIVELLENCFPVRVKGIHFMNVPIFLEFILNTVKSATKKKLAERIYVHRTLETLYGHVPKKVLPEEYGGCEETGILISERWKKKVENYRKKLLEEEFKMRRLDEFRTIVDESCEMVGTFRKLVVY